MRVPVPGFDAAAIKASFLLAGNGKMPARHPCMIFALHISRISVEALFGMIW
jgi:hypothetical protein